MPTRYEVCPVADLQPGDRILVEIDGLSIGVFNIDGEYYALNNICPHQLAPLCEGQVTGTTCSETPGEFESWERDGEIVRCPWHGWEFDITSGESLFNPHLRTRTFETDVAPSGADTDEESKAEYGVALAGEEPPVETFDVEVDQEMVFVRI